MSCQEFIALDPFLTIHSRHGSRRYVLAVRESRLVWCNIALLAPAPLIRQLLSMFFACSALFRYPSGTQRLEQYIHYLAVHCHCCFQCIFLRLLVFSILDLVTQWYYWYSWWPSQETSSPTVAKYCSLLPQQKLPVAPYLNMVKTSVERSISLNCKHTEKLVPLMLTRATSWGPDMQFQSWVSASRT